MIRSRFILNSAVALSLLCSPAFASDAKEEAQTNIAAVHTDFSGKPIKGKVLEATNASGYTYLEVETDKGNVWVAIPESKVEKGSEVVCNPGMEMVNFESKTLNRTFASIIFSSGLGDGDKPFNPNPHGSASAMGAMGGSGFDQALQAESGGNPHGAMGAMGAGMAGMGAGAGMAQSGGSSSAIVPSADVSVEKAEGENAYTIAQCFDQAKELDTKKVQVRGKVMKVSRMIMGKNWLHIQDGSGNPMNNTHDLVVTTMADPAENSIVVVEGTLHANRDFGAGYKYAVIIEDVEIK
ncbi:MAG: DNA-binding protein [Desulfobulbaceae bacterium]|nr:DNA-binding protein [Desulfobulbaceae bacterium]